MSQGKGASIALTIAGSDSGGGAGIQADLKAFSAHQTYGASVITALTSQNTREVRGIFAVTPDFVREQIDVVFEDLRVDAVKIGMLSDPEITLAVAEGLKRHGAKNVVLDPVMVAKSGDKLLKDEAIDALKTSLVPMASLITPNLPEAFELTGIEAGDDLEAMKAVARALRALGSASVLVKGGHGSRTIVTDLLFDGDEETFFFEAPRMNTKNTHGTGCTLSASIAAHLARGCSLKEAVAKAHAYLQEAIKQADHLKIGAGHGPVHHFHALWSGEALS